jgi:hypothetical protein
VELKRLPLARSETNSESAVASRPSRWPTFGSLLLMKWKYSSVARS